MTAFGDGFSDILPSAASTSGTSTRVPHGVSSAAETTSAATQPLPPSWLTAPVAGFEDVWARSLTKVDETAPAAASSASAVAADGSGAAQPAESDDPDAVSTAADFAATDDAIDDTTATATAVAETDIPETTPERASRGMPETTEEPEGDTQSIHADEPESVESTSEPEPVGSVVEPEPDLIEPESAEARAGFEVGVESEAEVESVGSEAETSEPQPAESGSAESEVEVAGDVPEAETDATVGVVVSDLSDAEELDAREILSPSIIALEEFHDPWLETGVLPDASAETDSALVVESESEPASEAVSPASDESELEPESEVGPAPVLEAGSTSDSHARRAIVAPVVIPDTESDDVELEPQAASESGLVSEPGLVSESGLVSKPDVEPEPDAVSESGVASQSETGTGANPETDAAPASDEPELQSEQPPTVVAALSDPDISGDEEPEGATEMPDNGGTGGDRPFVSPADEWASLLGQDTKTNAGVGEVYRPTPAPNRSVFGLTFVPDEAVTEPEPEPEEDDEDREGGLLKPIIALLLLAVVIALLFVFRAPLMGLFSGGEDATPPPATPTSSRTTQPPSATTTPSGTPSAVVSTPPESTPPTTAPTSTAPTTSTTTSTTTTTTQPAPPTTPTSVWPAAASATCSSDVHSNSADHCALANAIAAQVPRSLDGNKQVKAVDPFDNQKLYTGVCVKQPNIIQCSLASSDVQIFILPA
jgi:hypothetical protein